MSYFPSARWTYAQPWRGIFGLCICVAIALAVTSSFEMESYMKLMPAWAMSMVPVQAIITMTWEGKYPPTDYLVQPWRGIALSMFTFMLGTGIFWILLNLNGGGQPNPILINFIVCFVMITFWLVIAFNSWPFNKISFPAQGFFVILTSYVITCTIFNMFHFDTIFIPSHGNTQLNYAMPDGLRNDIADLNPHGPIHFNYALTYIFCATVLLFSFVHLNMWPFSKHAFMRKQPVLGFYLLGTCLFIACVIYFPSIWLLDFPPMKLFIILISYAFGLLMFLSVMQRWPGIRYRQPYDGFLNIALSILIATGAYYFFKSFCAWHFGTEWYVVDPASGHLELGPNGWLAMANLMLALIFPLWIVYQDYFDFWPLPPTSICSERLSDK